MKTAEIVYNLCKFFGDGHEIVENYFPDIDFNMERTSVIDSIDLSDSSYLENFLDDIRKWYCGWGCNEDEFRKIFSQHIEQHNASIMESEPKYSIEVWIEWLGGIDRILDGFHVHS